MVTALTMTMIIMVRAKLIEDDNHYSQNYYHGMCVTMMALTATVMIDGDDVCRLH